MVFQAEVVELGIEAEELQAPDIKAGEVDLGVEAEVEAPDIKVEEVEMVAKAAVVGLHRCTR